MTLDEILKSKSEKIVEAMRIHGLGDPMNEEDSLAKIVCGCISLYADGRPTAQEVADRLSALIGSLNSPIEEEYNAAELEFSSFAKGVLPMAII